MRMTPVAMAPWLIAGALLLGSPAWAQDSDNRALAEGGIEAERVPPWDVEPYWQPISYLQGEWFRFGPQFPAPDIPSVQLVGGIGGGVSYRQVSGPNLYGFTRAQGTMLYSLTYGSFGLEGKVGSFFGLDRKWFRVTSGPDFWTGLYQGADYNLPFSVGMDWRFDGRFKATRDLGVDAAIVPGWAFTKDRTRPGVLDRLEIGGYLYYQGEFSIRLGWRVAWNVAGRQHGPVIEMQFR